MNATVTPAVVRYAACVVLMMFVWTGAAKAAQEYVLRTDPPVAGASVYVDGAFAGTTDGNGKAVVSGTPGVHQIRVDHQGETFKADMTFDAELNALPTFKIPDKPVSAKEPGQQAVDYTIDANVADATVSVAGGGDTVTDSAGRATLRLVPGRQYSIAVRKSGFESQSTSLTVAAGGGQLSVVLQPRAVAAKRPIDLLLIGLVTLLVASVVLLFIVTVRGRRRTLPPQATGVMLPVAEQTMGHFDRYRLTGTLGSGGVGTIYRAFDLVDKTDLALKVLDSRWLSDPDMVRKFLSEAEALRAIMQSDAQAAIVKCFRYGREHDSIVGRPFIALELLEGETLQNRLIREPVLDELTSIAIGYQIAAALISVHGAGIVHRDLTPDNIFLREGDLLVRGEPFPSVPVVMLIDFGIARQELMSRMTMDGSIAGKPHFMSPEQCRGLAVDPRSDLYSLGIILFLMAAGRLPFAGQDPFDVMRAQQSEEAPRLPAHANSQYADLCGRLLQKDRDSRPDSATVAASELAELLESIAAASSINVVSFPKRRLSS